MPRIHQRTDDDHWTTPDPTMFTTTRAAGSDIPHDQHRQTVHEQLAAHNIDVQIVDQFVTPSYTMYQVTTATAIDTLQTTLATIAADRPDWILAARLAPTDAAHSASIFLRTLDHLPLALPTLLAQTRFTDTPLRENIILGVTLDQVIFSRLLPKLNQILLLGDDGVSDTLMRDILFTMLLTHTPTELRVALISTHRATAPDALRDIVSVPHTLGNRINNPASSLPLLRGFEKEIKRRTHLLEHSEHTSFTAYNAYLQQHELPQIPRIVVVIDAHHTPLDATWDVSLRYLLRAGGAVGLHTILLSDGSSIDELQDEFPTQIITRDTIDLFEVPKRSISPALWRFVDAFIIDGDTPYPVEIGITLRDELKRIVRYWKAQAQRRLRDKDFSFLNRRTDMTGWMESPNNNNTRSAPPKPAPPPIATLRKATQVLSQSFKDRLSINNGSKNNRSDTALDDTQDGTPVQDVFLHNQLDSHTLQQAHALALYLGWLGKAALQDVLDISNKEAALVISHFQAVEFLEAGDMPTPRVQQYIARQRN